MELVDLIDLESIVERREGSTPFGYTISTRGGIGIHVRLRILWAKALASSNLVGCIKSKDLYAHLPQLGRGATLRTLLLYQFDSDSGH